MPAKPRARKRESSRPHAPSLFERGLSTRAILLLLAAATFVFFLDPLFNSAATPQWDAIDVHYSAQKHFADSLRAGHLPFWTPAVYSGMPFLADPQIGAWYPPNWPFFLLGVTPKAIEWELALHALIAAAGAFLLARDLLGGRWPALFCAVLYAFSGFFAAHSSHLGMFQAAALFPWLLWTGLRAARDRRRLPAAALVAAMIVLAGHFQTALYSLYALALFLAADAVLRRARPLDPILAIAAAAAGATLLPAVATLPGLELTAHSIRAAADYSRAADAVLHPSALATLVSPNHFHAPDVEGYTGPQDITQYYYYGGILLLPLAIAGAALSARRWHAIVLALPALWFAFGPSAGLYSIVSLLPGLHSVRSPVHAWFIVALGLALLAGAGIAATRARWTSPWLPIALLAFTAGDLWHWNMSRNGLAYARQSFEQLYGAPEQRFLRVASSAIPPNGLHRLWAPFDSPAFGPLNSSLNTGVEVAYGYNPLELSRYSRYLEASAANPKLLDSLAVTAKFDPATGFFASNPTALPRLYAPSSVRAASGPEDAAKALPTLDPIREAIAEGAPAAARNGPADTRILDYRGDFYRARCRAAEPALIRLAVPYFPGWRASIDGRPAPVVPVDLALMGVVAPAGDHEVVFEYRSAWFAAGAAISAVAAVALAISLLWAFRRPAGDPLGQETTQRS